MRIVPISHAICCFVSVVVLMPNFADARPKPNVFGIPTQRQAQVARPSTPFRRRYDEVACNENNTTAGEFFVGVPGTMSVTSQDFAGGTYSGVLAGFANEACAAQSGIGAGEDNAISYDPNTGQGFIGAGYYNTIEGASYDAFVGAGIYNVNDATASFVGAGYANHTSGSGSFVGAGGSAFDTAQTNAYGTGNDTTGIDTFVGAGDLNVATGNGSFIGAGGYTYALSSSKPTAAGNQISGTDSFVGAGDQNSIAANDAFTGGGNLNSIGAAAADAVLAGGSGNSVTGQKGAIGGGESNEVSGAFAVVPGGYKDEALGNESFAAGSQAEAKYTGSFVWSDYATGETQLKDTAADQFVVRASGGVFLYSNAAATAGVKLNAGSGAWASLSDRNAKTDVVPLDDASILAKVAALPVTTWRYKTEAGVRHVGPMAQDFYAAFGVGDDDRHITSIDEDGVALAAIKALDRDNQMLRGENAGLRSNLAALRASVDHRNAILDARLDALERKLRR